jgi:hypothetical protein
MRVASVIGVCFLPVLYPSITMATVAAAGGKQTQPRKAWRMQVPKTIDTSGSGSEEEEEEKEVETASLVSSRSGSRSPVAPKRSYTPKLLAPRARKTIFIMSPKLSSDKTFTLPTSKTQPLVLNQTLAGIVQFIDRTWPLGSNALFPAAVAIARTFLMGGRTYNDHVRAMAARVNALGAVFEAASSTYVLDNKKSVASDTYTSPRLHFAKLGNVNMQQIVDWNERIVVKMYELGKIANDQSRLVDLAMDIMIGAALGDMLVLNAQYVVSPHMAFQLDWFPGPVMAVSPDPKSAEPKRLFVTTAAAQYVVVERADMTLDAFIETGLATPPIMRSLLWQLLYTLDASWETCRYLHYDLHTANVMVRDLAKEPVSPYTGRRWLYVRSHPSAQGPPMALVADHGNFFLEIIDYGRSRLYCPVPGADDARRVLLGSDSYAEFGMYASPQYMDRSWDMRRLFTYLLKDYDLSRFDTPTTPVTTRTVARNLKELFAVGSNLAYFMLFVLDNADYYRAYVNKVDPQGIQHVVRFVNRVTPFARKHLEPNRDAIVVDRTYVPPYDVAVEMYNLYQITTDLDTTFSRRLEKDMLALTTGPHPDAAEAEAAARKAQRAARRQSARPASPMSISDEDEDDEDGGPIKPSSLHRTVSASTLLGLPLFKPLEAAADIDAVLVGLVSAKASAWTGPLGLATPLNATALDAVTAASTMDCAVCCKPARGYAVNSNNEVATAREVAFCSDLCMDIHMGVIRAALPY